MAIRSQDYWSAAEKTYEELLIETIQQKLIIQKIMKTTEDLYHMIN